MKDIGERLKVTREALGLNQAQIARRVGVSLQAWNNCERGRQRVSIDMAIKLIRTIGVSFEWIFLGDPKYLPHDLAIKIEQVLKDKELLRRGR